MWLNQTFEISDYVKDFQPNLGNTIVFGTWTYTWDSGNFGIAILQPVRSTITRRQVLAIRKKSHSLPFLISLVCCSQETMWRHFSCGKVSHTAPWKWWCRHCPFSFNPFDFPDWFSDCFLLLPYLHRLVELVLCSVERRHWLEWEAASC